MQRHPSAATDAASAPVLDIDGARANIARLLEVRVQELFPDGTGRQS